MTSYDSRSAPRYPRWKMQAYRSANSTTTTNQAVYGRRSATRLKVAYSCSVTPSDPGIMCSPESSLEASNLSSMVEWSLARASSCLSSGYEVAMVQEQRWGCRPVHYGKSLRGSGTIACFWLLLYRTGSTDKNIEREISCRNHVCSWAWRKNSGALVAKRRLGTRAFSCYHNDARSRT